MAEEFLKSAKLEQKKTFALPKGSTLIKKDVSVVVEEIENGFLIRKTYDIKWSNEEGNSNYEYFTRTWFSDKNPITIDLPKEKSLAEKLS